MFRSGRYDALEMGHVRARLKFDPYFRFASTFPVILRESAANLRHSTTYDMVIRGIVIGGATEDFNADGPLFQLRFVSLEGALDDITEDRCISLAITKKSMRKDALEMFEDFLVLRVGRGTKRRDKILRCVFPQNFVMLHAAAKITIG